MSTKSNGRTPGKSTEEVAAELRERLRGELGAERTDAIWRDPSNVERVVESDEEAASVAGIILQAWDDLPQESPEVDPRHMAFRRGLQIAVLAALGVWAFALLRRARQER
jgi:hypothetical protein